MSSILSRTGSVMGRLTLLAVVVGGTGVLAGTLFLPTALTVTDVVDAVERDVFDVPPLPSTDPLAENSFVYASDDTLIDELARDQSRIPVSLEEIPDVMINAVVATEDSTFWEHNGINPTAIVRAALQNVAAGGIESGASTITQQYVKNAYIDAERRTEQSYNRKIQEALWAIDLEKQVSKQEILEGYLNRTYFGNGVYGVEKAAERYFSKELGDLELHEAAMLAGLIRAPLTNSPLGGETADPETGIKPACLDGYSGDETCNALARRDIVLNQMAFHGFITTDQADRAKAQPLGLVVSPPTEEGQAKWWLDWVAKQLTDASIAEAVGLPQDLLETLGETEEERFDYLFQGGLRIYTTIDLGLQAEAEGVIRDFLTYEDMPAEELARAPFGGLVTVEPGTGAVRVAAIGPYEYGSCSPTDGGEFIGVDGAGRLLCDKTKLYPVVPGGGGSGRQPGSSLKPFTVAGALEVGLPPGWEVDATGPAVIDGCDDNGGEWKVNNSGGNGIRDMYTGVKASSNVFHAKLIAEIGEEKTWEVLHRFGFEPDWQEKQARAEELDRPRNAFLRVKPACALALGAADVFPLEMAASYAGIANEGVYCKPYAISRIEDRDGKVIYEHTPDCEQAIDGDVARRVIDIMRGPVTPGGTAGSITGDLSPHPVRGKTGTTNDYIDAWFVGYTPQLATASWVGYPNGIVSFETLEQAQAACPQEFRDSPDRTSPFCFERRYMTGADSNIGGRNYGRVFGGTIPAPMWSRYMQIAMEGYEVGSFPSPGSLPGATVPDFSGLSTIAAMEELAEKAQVNLIIETVRDYRPKGAFVEQSPKAGTRVQAGNAVTVFLSDGKGEVPKVPNVVGKSEAEAREILEEAGYSVAKVTKETSDADQIGKVVGQSPAAGAELKPEEGSTVVIQIGIEAPEPEPSPSPSPSPKPTPSDPPSDPPTDPPSEGGGGGNGGGGGGNGGGGGGGGGGGDD